MQTQKIKNRFGRIVAVPAWKAKKMIKNDEAKIIKMKFMPKKRGRPPKK